MFVKNVFDTNKYVMFSNMRKLKRIIIYAKIANYWNLLNVNFDLNFSRIFRVALNRNQIKKFVVVFVIKIIKKICVVLMIIEL